MRHTRAALAAFKSISYWNETELKMKLVPRPGFFGGVAAVVDAEDEAVGGGVNLSADGLAMTNPLPPPPEAPPVG